MADTPLLEVDDLHVQFETEKGQVQALRGVSFAIEPGETFGVVGESGSGKTVSALAVMGLLDDEAEITRGSIRFQGEELLTKSDAEIRQLRGDDIAMVFQDPMSGLNPVLSVGYQVREAIDAQRDRQLQDRSISELIANRLPTSISQGERREAVVETLTRVGIPDPASRLDQYPHEFSGGMRQRVMIAIGISCRPNLLIVDEPTTALDVTTQANILSILNELSEELNMTILLISHNLGVIAQTCNRTAVMYAGEVMERGGTRSIFKWPQHPYTDGLLRAMPQDTQDDELFSIEGTVPELLEVPTGCVFRDRCPNATEECGTKDIPIEEVAGRDVRCIHPIEDAR